MRLHYLQHVPFEGLGYIEEWARFRGIEISATRLFAGEKPPPHNEFDWLVIMGGPMGIHDHADHPWLIDEKAFIRKTISERKRVLGICLGAQLIADALGARVYRGPQKEIGWFPIRRDEDAPKWFPENITAFHWHGDTFDIPDGAIRLASSAACENQGFIYRNRVLALQFHLESTRDSIEALIENCAGELVDGPFIQSAIQIRSSYRNLGVINAVLSQMLDWLPQP